jgi:hypothetical protein
VEDTSVILKGLGFGFGFIKSVALVIRVDGERRQDGRENLDFAGKRA